MIYIQTSNILSDDTLGFALGGAPRLDTLPEKERNNVLLKALEIKLYERLPSTAAFDHLLQNSIPFIAILSDVEEIAMQQSIWFEAISKNKGIDIMYTAMSDVEHSEDTMLIAEDRDALIRQGQAGGRILPFSTETQMPFIIETLNLPQ